MCVPSILWRPFPVGKEPFSKVDMAVVSYGMSSSRMRCLCAWDEKSPMWCLWASLCAVLCGAKLVLGSESKSQNPTLAWKGT